MLAEFRAEADVRGRQINVSWQWTAPESQRPAFQLVRRRRTFPQSPQAGLVLVDLAELFQPTDDPWGEIRRIRYLVPNAVVEGGLRQAEVAFYFVTAGAALPDQIVVTYFDEVTGAEAKKRLEEVSRVERSEMAAPPWSRIETREIFATPGGGPEVAVGQIVVSTGHEDGVTPDNFVWNASSGSSVSLPFDEIEELRTIVGDDSAGPLDEYALGHPGIAEPSYLKK